VLLLLLLLPLPLNDICRCDVAVAGLYCCTITDIMADRMKSLQVCDISSVHTQISLFVISPTAAVEKYYKEHVSVSVRVCLSV